jgi:hypothetical protein
MDIKCRVICVDGHIDVNYFQLSDIIVINRFYQHGRTEVTQEEQPDALVYRIPHLRLECTLEMFKYLYNREIHIHTTENSVVCDHPTLSPIDVLYVNGLYKLATKIHVDGGFYSSSRNCLYDYVKRELPTVNPYQFIERSIGESCLTWNSITIELDTFQAGQLPKELHDDLAEMILPRFNDIVHSSPLYPDDIKSVCYFVNHYTGPKSFGKLSCDFRCDRENRICPVLAKDNIKRTLTEMKCPRLLEILTNYLDQP